jgi:hypothetical protein
VHTTTLGVVHSTSLLAIADPLRLTCPARA